MISYQPLFETMKKMNISSYELAKRGGGTICILCNENGKKHHHPYCKPAMQNSELHRTMEQLHSKMKKIKR